MSRLFLAILAMILLLLGGLVVYVAAWDAPPATTRIEKPIPNDRLGR